MVGLLLTQGRYWKKTAVSQSKNGRSLSLPKKGDYNCRRRTNRQLTNPAHSTNNKAATGAVAEVAETLSKLIAVGVTLSPTAQSEKPGTARRVTVVAVALSLAQSQATVHLQTKALVAGVTLCGSVRSAL